MLLAVNIYSCIWRPSTLYLVGTSRWLQICQSSQASLNEVLETVKFKEALAI